MIKASLNAAASTSSAQNNTTNNLIDSNLNSNTNTTNNARNKRLKGLVNNDYCSYCDEGGSLINCDRCPASFHLLCHEPPLEEIPQGDFLCNACKYAVNMKNQQETYQKNASKHGLDLIFNHLTELIKSSNPRQMELSRELNAKCDIKIPGLNRVKWWIHEKCKSAHENHHHHYHNQNSLNYDLNKSSSKNETNLSNINGKNGNSLLEYIKNKKNSMIGQAMNSKQTCFICQK